MLMRMILCKMSDGQAISRCFHASLSSVCCLVSEHSHIEWVWGADGRAEFHPAVQASCFISISLILSFAWQTYKCFDILRPWSTHLTINRMGAFCMWASCSSKGAIRACSNHSVSHNSLSSDRNGRPVYPDVAFLKLTVSFLAVYVYVFEAKAFVAWERSLNLVREKIRTARCLGLGK